MERIKSLKQEAIEVLRTWGITRVCEGQFEPSVFNTELNPGQIIELGPEFSVKAIPTPGHTWDFLSYYVPKKKIVIDAEAVGCDDVSEFFVDYNAYRSSIGTLSRVDVEVLCTGHHLVLTGSDAKKHILRNLDKTSD